VPLDLDRSKAAGWEWPKLRALAAAGGVGKDAAGPRQDRPRPGPNPEPRDLGWGPGLIPFQHPEDREGRRPLGRRWTVLGGHPGLRPVGPGPRPANRRPLLVLRAARRGMWLLVPQSELDPVARRGRLLWWIYGPRSMPELGSTLGRGPGCCGLARWGFSRVRYMGRARPPSIKQHGRRPPSPSSRSGLATKIGVGAVPMELGCKVRRNIGRRIGRAGTRTNSSLAIDRTVTTWQRLSRRGRAGPHPSISMFGVRPGFWDRLGGRI